MTQSVVGQYERLRQLSATMADLAAAQSWQALVVAQQEREALMGGLAPTLLRRLPPAEQSRIRDILTAIRECDARVVAEIAPWHAQIGQLLRGLGVRSPDPAA